MDNGNSGADGVSELQQLVRQYEALLAERQALIARHRDDGDELYRALPEYKDLKRSLFDLWRKIQQYAEPRPESPIPSRVAEASRVAVQEEEDIDLGTQAPPHEWLTKMLHAVSQLASAHLTRMIHYPTQSCR